MATLTTALTRLRSDFNTRFPSRLKTSDGWIGDYQHQQNKSGHNPDDTSGSKPEYTDPDAKAEVRAIDVDKDLNDPGGVTMQQCCDAIRNTERDRKRLAYMIYKGRIASQSSGWAWQTYTGSNPHNEHAHFSGDPDYDEDGAEFASITQIGDDDVSEADVIKGLQKDTDWQHPSVGPRMEALGWGNLSERDLAEYLFERTLNIQTKLDQIMAAVLNVDEEVVNKLSPEFEAAPEEAATMLSAALGTPDRIRAVAQAMLDGLPASPAGS